MPLIDMQGQVIDPLIPLGICMHPDCFNDAWTATPNGLRCAQHTVRTADEVRDLCWNWRNDPCWDLETTEGFEAHAPELLEYRLEWERKWEQDRQDKIAEKACELGAPGNLKLAEYVILLERKIRVLEIRVFGE